MLCSQRNYFHYASMLEVFCTREMLVSSGETFKNIEDDLEFLSILTLISRVDAVVIN